MVGERGSATNYFSHAEVAENSQSANGTSAAVHILGHNLGTIQADFWGRDRALATLRITEKRPTRSFAAFNWIAESGHQLKSICAAAKLDDPDGWASGGA